jgi:hypothetical protein
MVIIIVLLLAEMFAYILNTFFSNHMQKVVMNMLGVDKATEALNPNYIYEKASIFQIEFCGIFDV